MPRAVAFIFLLYLVCLSHGHKLEKNEVRNEKLFSLFSVVTFPNQQCAAASSTASQTTLGTCYSASECASKSGTADGNCASGFGVCCTFLKSACSSSVTNNCTYITNPSYPSAYTTTTECAYTVTPISSDICSIRLDLDYFDIAEVATTGACTDTFAITSSSSLHYYNLCGTLTGQHLHLETARSTTDTKLAFTPATTGSVTFRIKISQIECYSESKPPNGCLQYMTSLSGTVTSFNYPTVMLAPMQYTVCVRQDAGFCGVQWAPTDTTSPDTFNLDDTETIDGLAGIATGSDAYIIINGSPNLQYGGNALSDDATTTDANMDHTNGAVEGYGVPNRLTVVSVSNTAGGAAIGFSLTYRQIPCAGVRSRTIQP